MKTWGPLRRLKVVNKGLIQGDIKTLGDFLDLGEFDCLSGRTEFKYQDLCKIGILLKSQGVELEETIYGTMNPSYFLKDWLPKFDKLFKSKGIFYNPVHCDMGVNLGLERYSGIEDCDLCNCIRAIQRDEEKKAFVTLLEKFGIF